MNGVKTNNSRRRFLTLPAALLVCALLLGACGGAVPAETLTVAAGPGTDLTVHCFSAGKADAFLLYTAGSAVLIDAGEKGFGKEILAYLEEAGVGALDYLILTHFDKDHVGGAAKILNSIPVETVLQSNSPKDSEEYEKYTAALKNAGLTAVTVRETESFLLDGVAYTVCPPRRETYAEDASNNSSLIVSVENGENDLLFTGDAQEARLAEFIAVNGVDYEFLKVPYHGRWQTGLPALLDSTTPELAVITSSDAEPEDPQTLAALAAAGAETYLTRDGPVTLLCDGREIRVKS